MYCDAGPSNWKCICILIFSVGVQRCDEFIQVQKGLQTTRQTDIKAQKVRVRLDR